MHLVPLPFTKLFMHYDKGVSQSPDKLTGPIGRKFNMKVGDYPSAVNFEPIPGKCKVLPDEYFRDLNKDLKLLYSLALAVQNGPGKYDPDLMNREIGHVHKARWHNNIASILKQYMTNSKPSQSLKRLCIIILNWYIPFLQFICENWRLQDGAKCYFQGIALASKCLEKTEINIFKTSFQWNSYMAHPEFVLLAGLFDPDLRIRQKAVDYILLDRKRRSTPGHVMRQWVKPTVNFQAKTYWDICDKSNIEYMTEPPITFDISDDALKSCAKTGVNLIIPDIPIHSINNERAVQETSKVCRAYSTYEKRHKALIMTLNSRKKLPTEASKEHFKRL